MSAPIVRVDLDEPPEQRWAGLAPHAAAGASPGVLADTSCERFDRAAALLRAAPPADAEGCFAILDDAAVRMHMTLQQMVLHAGSGGAEVRIPDRPASGGV